MGGRGLEAVPELAPSEKATDATPTSTNIMAGATTASREYESLIGSAFHGCRALDGEPAMWIWSDANFCSGKYRSALLK
jgi:hypothetical protein